jgi:predicted  nucleic acid-binding Zn-ribbon protein
MTDVEPDWRGVIRFEAVKSGPEQYAPPDRRVVKTRDEIESIVRISDQADTTSDATNELNKRIQLAAGASMDEIDRVIRELEGVRDLLRDEAERVSREIAGFASLSHASMTAMQVIAETIQKWKAI